MVVPPLPSRPPRATGVVIADGQTLVRAGLRSLLAAQPDIAVLGEAPDAEHTRELIVRTHPAVVLMELSLPGLEGVHGARRLIAEPRLAGARFVVLLSEPARDADVFEALRTGAAGLLVKDARAWQLVDAVRAVAAGEGVVSPCLTRHLIDALAALPETTRSDQDELAELTRRERQVVALVAGGMSNLEIAEHLVISPATAKTHVSRALGKLAARDRAQLVTLAYETGLVVPRAALNAA